MEMNNMLILEGLDRLSEDQFFHFCAQNRQLRIERQADGTVTIMSPTGFHSDDLNTEVVTELKIWSRQNSIGVVTGSSAGFLLPDHSMLSPDASWISDERLIGISPAAMEKFLPACPNFVVEILSPSDSLPALKRKMRLWIQNGAEVAWLIDPKSESVTIYAANQEPVTVEGFDQTIGCPKVLPGFELDLRLLKPKHRP